MRRAANRVVVCCLMCGAVAVGELSAGDCTADRNGDPAGEPGVPGPFSAESLELLASGKQGKPVAADLDGDGRLDLVVGYDAGRFSDYGELGGVRVFRNQGGGRFDDPVTYASGSRPLSVAVADFNGDGRLDIVANNFFGIDTENNSPRNEGLILLVNQGDGVFGSPEYRGKDVHPHVVVAGDFNGDGTADLMAHYYREGNRFRFYVTRADGTFDVAGEELLDVHTYSDVAADLNGDGLDDVVAVVIGRDELIHLVNQGDGRFVVETIPAYSEPTAVTVVDLDGDGALDLAVSGSEEPNTSSLLGGHLSIHRGDGTGRFTRSQRYPTSPVENFPLRVSSNYVPHDLIPGDMDGDGDTDFVTTNAFSMDVVVLFNEDGTFPTARSFDVGFRPWRGGVADLDGDGDLDVMAVNDSDRLGRLVLGRVVFLWNGSIPGESESCTIESFRRGDCDGDGSVGGSVSDALALLNFNFRGGAEPACLAACDANGDGLVRGEITDAVVLLRFAFLGGDRFPSPFRECGTGTARDEALGCREAPAGCR